MKNLLYFFIIGLQVFILSCKPSDVSINSYDTIKEAFLNPPPEARPKAYWWCLNGNIDTITAKKEFIAMKEAGITGFDLFEIGDVRQDTMHVPAGPAFMSDESLQLIKFAVEEAGKLGLNVGLNLSSSWNAGGSWVEPKHAGKSLYFSKTEISGNSTKQQLKLPFPDISFSQRIGGTKQSLIPFDDDGKPEYYEEIAILAIPSRSGDEKIDPSDLHIITPFFNPETEILNWDAPPGNWEIVRYVCSNSGQQIVLPSPYSSGLTIDHFDAEAVESHILFFIKSLESILGDINKTALKSFYLASYEARGLVWTSTLPKEFKKNNGYEIEKFLPIFSNPEIFEPETVLKVETDFKKTLSELMINNLYKNTQNICKRYGLKINSEAGGPGYPLYNGPAEPLKAQGAIDIPRGEFWINHSRFYMDKNDSIDVLRIVKETAAASHIYEKGIVEMEAFTSFMHWQEAPIDMRPFGDRAFCEGMNRVVFHGFSHNITNSGYPGYVYSAGTHINKRVWWPKAKPFIDYLSRISGVFQQADFKSDVVWYYGDKVPNATRPKNTHFKVGPGYDYEVINTEVLLNGLKMKNGKLVLHNKYEFSLLVLEDEDNFTSSVLKKLSELASKGALIIGEKPGKIDGIVATGKSKKSIDNLWVNLSDKPKDIVNHKGRIISGVSALEALQAINVQPDINYFDKYLEHIDYIHFEKDDIAIYFIRNTRDISISRNIGFRQQNKSPEIWDPVSGEIYTVSIFSQNGDYTTLPISLPPYGSCMVVFNESSLKPDFTSISIDEASLPTFEYSRDGIIFLGEDNFTLTGKDKSVTIHNNITQLMVEGAWEVSFAKGWGAPEKAVFPELMSWTDSEIDGIKYYSGLATYKKIFQFNEDPATTGKKVYLDLGEVSKIADVWINGQPLGISWTKPHRFEITGILKQGENILQVEVGNTWSNRLTGDALTGENYTNTNMTSTIIPAPTMETGDQTRYPWAKVPLIKSGLLGPVTIQIYHQQTK